MPSLPSGIARHCPLAVRTTRPCGTPFVRAIAALRVGTRTTWTTSSQTCVAAAASTAGASASGVVLGQFLRHPLTHRVVGQRLAGTRVLIAI